MSLAIFLRDCLLKTFLANRVLAVSLCPLRSVKPGNFFSFGVATEQSSNNNTHIYSHPVLKELTPFPLLPKF